MALGDDPRGGIDKIAAASAEHMSPHDVQVMREIILKYATNAKDYDGFPTNDKLIENYNGRIAAEDIITSWTVLSEGALNKFMDDHY